MPKSESQLSMRIVEPQYAIEARKSRQASGTPAHWLNAKGGAFTNPWPSWRFHTTGDIVNLIAKSATSSTSPPKDIATRMPTRTPTWGLKIPDSSHKIKATWLGHACFFVEMPLKSTAGAEHPRGARVLFDPVFSDRCSPSQWVGPKRYTPPPCKIEDIPEVDAIIISHNHYDHMDTRTLKTLAARSRRPHVFAPLGNGPYFKSLGIPDTHVHILDWWDTRRVSIPIAGDAEVEVEITCTPAQHFTGRGILDRFKTLWSSWVVTDVPDSAEEKPQTRVFFGGDTGYRAVHPGDDEDEVPMCPAFKEIGEKFGGFEFAMIPIGAYMPREFMSPIHCAPQDSVRLFQDVRAMRAVGMHWGTWILTSEDVLEPPKRLAEECKKVNIEDGKFGVCELGETLVV